MTNVLGAAALVAAISAVTSERPIAKDNPTLQNAARLIPMQKLAVAR